MTNITLARLTYGNDLNTKPGLEVDPIIIDADRIVQMTDVRLDNEMGPHCIILYDSPIEGKTEIRVKQLSSMIRFMIRTKVCD